MAKWEVEVWDGADGATLLRDGSTCAGLHSVEEANEIARKLNAFPKILEFVEKFRETQKRCYGDGVNTHIKMIHLADEAAAIVTKAEADNV